MTAPQLAKKLLEAPDLPVVINEWGGGVSASEVTNVGEVQSESY